MRKLAVLTFLTLDGVMQAPGGPQEDPSDGFDRGGWVAGYWDDVLGEVMNRQMRASFDLLLGRRTYDIFASYWPKAPPETPGAKELNAAKKYVVSKTLRNPEWANSLVISGDVGDEVRKLKQEDGPEIQVHGSGNLIQTLLKEDLIDELRLKTFPVTLGKGKRLFADGTIAAGFKLLDSRTSDKGVIVADYLRSGDVKTGSFA